MSTNIFMNLSNHTKQNNSITMHYVEHLTHTNIIPTIPIFVIQTMNKFLIFNNDHIIITNNTKILNILILKSDLLHVYSNMKLKLKAPQLGKSFYLMPIIIEYQDNILHVDLCIKTTIRESQRLYINEKVRKILMVKLSKLNTDYSDFQAKFKMSFNTEHNEENSTKLHSFLMDKTQTESTITLSYKQKNLELQTFKKIFKQNIDMVIKLTFYF